MAYKMARQQGLEPRTYCLEGRKISIQQFNITLLLTTNNSGCLTKKNFTKIALFRTISDHLWQELASRQRQWALSG